MGDYADCCGRIHAGTARATTAEALMRSRYSAFAVGDTEYLLASWHASTRPPSLELDPARRWTGLEILDRVGGGPFDSQGEVEFRAHYRDGGRSGVQTERSRFQRAAGTWFYVNGDH
ncbi:YchJ family protein [Actinokineospora guangxiensis]|uniref:YchJ family protein n=1 Tax=Actinokineospora guangxiensis TaxID=1490288 RepID=A0ABW0EIT8_9PSEU